MAEQFLTLMADLDGASQRLMSGWYEELKKAGFTGTQTPGLPYHISLASFPLSEEEEAVRIMERAARAFDPIPVHISHIGIFSPGKVLFGAPEKTAELIGLHDLCEPRPSPDRPWTPHVTLLIDEPETVCAALPRLLGSFRPFVGTIGRLHLCAFWPTREIGSASLKAGG